jgi:citrate synthase
MNSGLEGVVAAETVLTHVDGSQGIWWLRGHRLPEVIARYGYEGAAALLWDGFAGSGLSRESMSAAFAAERQRAFAALATWLPVAQGRPLVEALRIAIAALPEESGPAAIAAAFPVAVAALLRAERGAAPVPPDPGLATAADFLRMLDGEAPSAARAAALDAYLTTVIDNGLAASTFAARVVASTRASLASAVLGG